MGAMTRVLSIRHQVQCRDYQRGSFTSDFGFRPSSDFGFRIFGFKPSGSQRFSLIEIMVTVGLLTFIILGLLLMFNQTQRAFRTGMTQTDVLGSRARHDGYAGP
jgi:hypothetical protein